LQDIDPRHYLTDVTPEAKAGHFSRENLADADGLGLLANIGIVKDRKFEPDADTKVILNTAARRAGDMILLAEHVHPAILIAARKSGEDSPLREVIKDGE
jgi:hypothetical protein